MMRAACFLSLSLLCLAGCENRPDTSPESGRTGDEVRREVGEAAEAAGEYAAQKRDEYARELRNRLKEYEPEIEKLRDRIQEAGEEARPRLERQLAQMRERRDALLREIERIEKASGAAWQQFRDGAERAWDAFRRSMDESKAPAAKPAETASDAEDTPSSAVPPSGTSPGN